MPATMSNVWGWLAMPMRAWGARARVIGVLVGLLVGVGFAGLQVAGVESLFHVPDSSHYLKIAAGETNEVMQPFASRQMGALIAGALGRVLPGGVRAGFVVEGVVALVVSLGIVLWLVVRTAAPRWMLLGVVMVPFWVQVTQDLVLPDLWYAALLAVLLWMLAREWWMAAAVMMLPLMVSRESTALTVVCLLLAAWRGMRWRERLVAVGSFVGGGVIVGRLAARALPNPEHLPEPVYVLAKVPWNFLRNVVGVQPWSNADRDLCQVPAWSMPFHLGPVHSVGVCGWSFGQPIEMLAVVLGNFGVLPLLAAMLWWQRRRSLPGGLLLRFCLIYGAACVVLAPVLGAGFQHLFGYAWPLFLVAVPMLWEESAGWRVAAVGAAHFAVVGLMGWGDLWPRMAVQVGLWVLAAWLLRTSRAKSFKEALRRSLIFSV
jgi:hypothetical protein